MSTETLSPQAERLHRLICRLARRDGHAAVRTDKLCVMLAQDAKRATPYSVRNVRYLLAQLRDAGLVETQTDYRMLYIRPLADTPSRRRTPAPPQPFAARPAAQPIAQPEGGKCTPDCTATPYKSFDGEDVFTKTTTEPVTTKSVPVSRPALPAPATAVVVDMMKIGWSRGDAQRLVAEYGAARCARCLTLPTVKVAANPAGMHRRAVEGDWKAPSGRVKPVAAAAPAAPPSYFTASADDRDWYARATVR